MSGAAKKVDDVDDPTIYPVHDDMGEGSLQRLISELLRSLIERWLEERGTPTFVGADQFFYWEQFNASEGIAPDVYVLPGAELAPRVGAWLVWKTGLVPSFAFEVVSSDVDKDYRSSPPKYDRLGVDELVIFDPDYPDYEEGRARVRWQVYRRQQEGLRLVEATDADRITSRVLGCHLRAVGEGGALRVRLATGRNGRELFPTDTEAREQAETARKKAEVAHKMAETARARLEQELAEERRARATLEAELARLKAKGPHNNGH